MIFDDLVVELHKAIELGDKSKERALRSKIFDLIESFELDSELKGWVYMNLEYLRQEIVPRGSYYPQSVWNKKSEFNYEELSIPRSFHENGKIFYKMVQHQEYEEIKKIHIPLFGIDSYSRDDDFCILTGYRNFEDYHLGEENIQPNIIFMHNDTLSKCKLSSEVKTYFEENKIRNLYGKLINNKTFICGTWGIQDEAKLLICEIDKSTILKCKDITPVELNGNDDIFVQNYDSSAKILKIGTKPGSHSEEYVVGYLNIETRKFYVIKIGHLELYKPIVYNSKRNHVYLHQFYKISEEYHYVLLLGAIGSFLLIQDSNHNTVVQYYLPLTSDGCPFGDFPWSHTLYDSDTQYLYIIDENRIIYRFHFDVVNKKLKIIRTTVPIHGDISSIMACSWGCYFSINSNNENYVLLMNNDFHIYIVHIQKDSQLPISQMYIEDDFLICLCSGRYYGFYYSSMSRPARLSSETDHSFKIILKLNSMPILLSNNNKDNITYDLGTGNFIERFYILKHYSEINEDFNYNLFNQILYENDSTYKVNILIADFLFLKGKYEQSSELYKKYLMNSSVNISILLKYIECLKHLKQNDEANELENKFKELLSFNI
jgi:hypothetical protein